MLELATSADRAAVNALARQVHELHVSWRPDIFRSVKEIYTEERFLECIQARQLYVAKLNCVTVGYILTRIREYDIAPMQPRRIFVLEEICVDESFRGHGIGTRIMEEFHALARAFGCSDLELGVHPENDDAVSFYQKCGLTIKSIHMQRRV